ncbi:DUF1822 family protein [Nostoc sp. B(2019)]|nr:DUF1822 family protein [Nostoc sp. B(2019)]
MSQTAEPLIFTVPLSFEAHSLAQQFRSWHSNPQKAKQVYLNTLALYAVDFYIRCLGFETDLEHSDSHNPICLKFMDVADLLVKHLGKLECRPVLLDAQVCQIPPESWSDRIGYVAVRLSPSLKQATLLGFTQTALAEMPLSQMRSLAEFPEYLYQIRQAALTAHAASPNNTVVKLSNWLEGLFEATWQEIAAFLEPTAIPSVSMRRTVEPFVTRGKLINLGTQPTQQSVVLVLTLTPEDEQAINIMVEVCPTNGQMYLTENLQIMVLNEEGVAVMQAIAKGTNQNIQFHFSGEPGERFSIKLALDNTSVIDDFVI